MVKTFEALKIQRSTETDQYRGYWFLVRTNFIFIKSYQPLSQELSNSTSKMIETLKLEDRSRSVDTVELVGRQIIHTFSIEIINFLFKVPNKWTQLHSKPRDSFNWQKSSSTKRRRILTIEPSVPSAILTSSNSSLSLSSLGRKRINTTHVRNKKRIPSIVSRDTFSASVSPGDLQLEEKHVSRGYRRGFDRLRRLLAGVPVER